MNSFRIVLLACFIGLACAQIDLNRLRDVLGDDADDFFKRLDQGRRGGFGSNPFGNDPFGNQRRQRPQRPQRDQRPDASRPSSPALDAKLKPSDCICRMKGQSRIVNGQVAAENSIPWQVSLASYGQHFCGASIINARQILTAAHCIDSNLRTPEKVQVRVGLHRLTDANPTNTYTVKKIHMHPYTTISKPGDYAILELEKPIKFIPGKVEPGCINNVQQDYPNGLIVSGWGTTSKSVKDTRTGKLQTGQISPILKRADLYQEKSNCQNYLICVNSKNGDSVCQGDSGGPIHQIKNGRALIEGVASFVTGTSNSPNGKIEMCTGSGAYSANHYYKQFFANIVGDNYCKM